MSMLALCLIVLCYNEFMKPTYHLEYNLEKDIWNWYFGANFGKNGEKYLNNVRDKEMLAKIQSVDSLEAAEPILYPFLQQKLDDPKSELNDFLKIIKNQFAKDFDRACEIIVKITNRPLAINKFILYVTTFPRMVVFYDEGVIFVYAKTDNELWGMPLDGFLHELLHFQTNKFWRQNPNSPVSKLSDEDYFKLKESLTVILDEELKPIITLPDCSYPEFKDFRDKLHLFWHQNHDFDALIEYGVKNL